MAKKALDDWRFERKYTLKLEEFLQFEKLLLRSDLSVLHPDRQINNCYFDDVNSNGLVDSVEGYGQRNKTRIRWYGPVFGKYKPKLEFKIKQNNSNKKEIFKLYEVDITEQFNWDIYIDEVRSYLRSKHDFFLSQNLFPALINSYHRTYYSNFRKTFRLTIDRKMRFYSPSGKLRNKIPYETDLYIIELKFENSSILSDFQINTNLGKFSKFSTGLELLQ